MGQDKDALRLATLAGADVEAVVLVDHPKGFARATDLRHASGAGATAGGEPLISQQLRERMDPAWLDQEIETHMAAGIYLGLTAHDVVLATRSRVSGRPREVIRAVPRSAIRIEWLDEELDGMRSRILLVTFPDDTWALFATPWKRLVPDDALTLIESLGASARRLNRTER